MSNLTGFVKRLRDIMRNDAGINGDAQRIEQITWLLFLKVYDAKEQDWEFDDDNYKSIIPENCRWANWAADDKSGKAMTGEQLLDFVNNTLFPTLKKLEITKNTPVKKAIVQTTFADANNYMKDGVLLRQVINVIDELNLSDYNEIHAFGEIYETILKELQSAGSSGEFYTPRAVTDFMAQMIKPKIGEKMADFACGTGGFLTSWLKELKKQIVTTDDNKAYSNSIYGIEKKQFPYMLCITNLLLHDVDNPCVYHDNSLLRDHFVTSWAFYIGRFLCLFLKGVNASCIDGRSDGEDGNENWVGYGGTFPRQGLSLVYNLKEIRKNLAKVTVPMISIHDKGDKTVPFGNQKIIISSVKSRDIESYSPKMPDYRHTHHSLLMYDSCKKEYTALIMKFFAKEE